MGKKKSTPKKKAAPKSKKVQRTSLPLKKKTVTTRKPVKNALAAKKLKTASPVVTRSYAEPKFVPLKPGTVNTGNANEYNTPYATQDPLQPIPAPRQGANIVMQLSDVIGQAQVNAITNSGMLVFHSIGDTGADKQFRIVDENDVAGMMAKDLSNPKLNERPAFFYHLGDVVYEFGQPECYYAQFYEPYCMYNAPIFAIPGNHDGMIWDASMTSLEAFLNNFCAPQPGPAVNAAGLHRSTMNQPGVYFTLEAPFVSIIGLWSNVSDKGPGVISSQNGTITTVTDDQKNFLISELKRLAPLRNQNQTAVIVAVHHPPFTGSDLSTQPLCNDLDDAFQKGGLWPDLVLSGHAHLYERFERNVNGRIIPYVVAGCGSYNLNGLTTTPGSIPASVAANNPTLKSYITAFGYMKIKVTQTQLAVVFNSLAPGYGNAADSFVINLKTHQITEGTKGKEPL